MKKMNKKGFTLVELLAVIVIMGVLMMVAIPAVQKTIENSKKDMYLDTAKQYVNAVKTLVVSDSLECMQDDTTKAYTPLESLIADNNYYYVRINSAKQGSTEQITYNGSTYDVSVPYLLQEGGKSPWNKDVEGWVLFRPSETDSGRTYNYQVWLKETSGQYLVANTNSGYTAVNVTALTRKNVRKNADNTRTYNVRLCREI